ncbi:MAG: hypothetical protein ACYSRP_03795 [Planctomycetota bacterium]|jgi:hypothetical protein
MGSLTVRRANDLRSSIDEGNNPIQVTLRVVSYLGIFFLIAIFVMLMEKM